MSDIRNFFCHFFYWQRIKRFKARLFVQHFTWRISSDSNYTKTDTSFYLKDRAIVPAISLVFIFIACLLNELLDSIYYAWCAIFLFVILSTFYFLRKCRTGLERLIVIISNPILYIAVCLICFGYDLTVLLD